MQPKKSNYDSFVFDNTNLNNTITSCNAPKRKYVPNMFEAEKVLFNKAKSKDVNEDLEDFDREIEVINKEEKKRELYKE